VCLLCFQLFSSFLTGLEQETVLPPAKKKSTIGVVDKEKLAALKRTRYVGFGVLFHRLVRFAAERTPPGHVTNTSPRRRALGGWRRVLCVCVLVNAS
jgi:hypothetical protein